MGYGDILNIRDLVMAPICLVLIVSLALLIRKQYTKRNPILKRYFMPALYLRLLGCFLSALMYQYYYGYGDTFTYYNGSLALIDILSDDLLLGLKVLYNSPETYDEHIISYFQARGAEWFTEKSSSMLIIKFGAVLGVFCAKSYLSIGFILAVFSFIGCWKIYEVFYTLYPQYSKQLALGILFVPSLFFWGSAGLMKDTITLAATGFLFNSVYFLVFKRKRIISSSIYLFISIYLLITLKLYIAIVFTPALILWVFIKKFSTIKSKVIRVISMPVLITLPLILGPYLFIQLANSNNRYKLDQVARQIEVIQLDFVRHKGSTYSLGEFDASLQGIISMTPKAINVSLFRPYLWESKSFALLFSALESTVILIFFIYVLLKVGLFRIVKTIFRNPDILFCVIFSLGFALVVGISAFNFGALVRYRIVLIPFFLTALILILNQNKKVRRSLKYS